MTTYPKRADWRNEIGTVIHKVGDVIEDCTPDNAPDEGVVLIDVDDEVCRMEDGSLSYMGVENTWSWAELNFCTPLTVIYVPKEEA